MPQVESMSQSKVEKTRARLQKRIQEGAYYEAHQQLRVLSQRYLKADNHDAAIDILFSGAHALLQAGQVGSGGDLCALMVEVYVAGGIRVDAVSKARIITLMGLIAPGEPSRKKFIKETVAWSAKFGDVPSGDPELQHFIGTLYADEEEYPEAEKHLLCGTKSSADTLASILYTWYSSTPTSDSESPDPAHFLSRAILPYILIRNLRDATRVYNLFTEKLVPNHPVQEVQSSTCDAKVFADLPLVNFLGMVLLAVQRGSGAANTGGQHSGGPGAELWRMLKSHYVSDLNEAHRQGWGWEEPLESIAEIYFGIRVQRQTSLLDMMGSLFVGGGMGGSGGVQAQLGTAPPPVVDLD